jgi:hypothetical protein
LAAITKDESFQTIRRKHRIGAEMATSQTLAPDPDRLINAFIDFRAFFQPTYSQFHLIRHE